MNSVQTHFARQAAVWESHFAFAGSMFERPSQFLELVREFVPPQASVLDFGCGAGQITAACLQAGFDARGIDSSAEMIACARSRFPSLALQLDLLPETSTHTLPYADGAYEGIVASSVLEYVANPTEVLRELRRVCRPGGALIISIPDMRHPRRWLELAACLVLAPARHTGWHRLSRYADYLCISQNRFDVIRWRALFAGAGWTVCALRRGGPLMMLIAKAV